MKTLLSVVSATLIGLAVVPSNSGNPKPTGGSSYVAGVYSAGPAGLGQQRLRLFPPGSGERDIPLPFRLAAFAVSPDGKSLYARVGLETPQSKPKPGMFKIEFNPTRATLVPGTTSFTSFGFAISEREDMMLISGIYSNGDSRLYGVFELMLKNGDVRQVLKAAGPESKQGWIRPSLSPDGLKAVALVHLDELVLIDLTNGTTTSLGQRFWRAAWSPDGKRIAALEISTELRVILFETRTFARSRILSKAEPVWSFDSRYLLALKWHPSCSPYFFTLEKVDIETDDRTIIEGSRCSIVDGTPLWMSSEILP